MGKSVYGELKLSEQLANDLETIKRHVDNLNEQLEESNYDRDQLRIEVDQLYSDMVKKDKDIIFYRNEITQMRVDNKQKNIKAEQMIRSCKTLLEFVTVSEQYRKEFSEKLRLSLAKSEGYKNQIIELT